MPMPTTTADLHPDFPGRIVVWTDFRLKEQVKMIPGAKWDRDARVWTVPQSWPACLALRAEFAENLTIGAALGAWAAGVKPVKTWLRTSRGMIEPDESSLAIINDLRSKWSPDDDPFDALLPYQLMGALQIYMSRGYMLTDETGTGKSRSGAAGLKLIELAEGRDGLGPTLIIAPKSMLITWSRELQPFFPDADIRVVSGTPTKQTKALEPGGDFYIVSWQGLKKYSRQSPFGSVTLKPADKEDKALQEVGIRTVLADEAHRAKNPKSAQTRALWGVSRDATCRVAMTGTPIQDTAEDFWSLLRFVAPDEYATKTGYVDRYLDVSFNEWGARVIEGLHPARGDEFLSNAETRFRRITKAVALPFLPPKIQDYRFVELPASMRRAYKTMVKDMVAELEGGSVLTADGPLTRAGRLTQLANCSGAVDEDGKFHMELPSPKIDAFLEDLVDGDFGDSQIVIYSDSRQLADLLLVEMRKLGEKEIPGLTVDSIDGGVEGEVRQDIMDAFQSGKLQYVIVTRAGAEGITLTAADTMVRLMRSWSLITHKQSEDRVHRIGSERHESIKIVDYVTVDTIEEDQIIRLNGKEERAQEVLRDTDLLAMLK